MLLDEDWCRFLAEEKILVGISIDGPAAIHDAHRKSVGGKPSFQQVMRAVGLLKRFGVQYNALATITPANVDHPEEIYAFLTRQVGSTVLQFQPCVERKDFRTVAPGKWEPHTMPIVGSAAATPGHPDSMMTDWSISAEGWGEFLCRLFDVWYPERHRIIINWFDSWASQ